MNFIFEGIEVDEREERQRQTDTKTHGQIETEGQNVSTPAATTSSSPGSTGACSEPLGVANAYITSTAPYNTGDRVYFRCYDGFTMSGTPSLECQSSGSFSGTYPTCTANDQAVTVKQSITSPNGE